MNGSVGRVAIANDLPGLVDVQSNAFIPAERAEVGHYSGGCIPDARDPASTAWFRANANNLLSVVDRVRLAFSATERAEVAHSGGCIPDKRVKESIEGF